MKSPARTWLTQLGEQAEQARLQHFDLLVDASNLHYPLLSRLDEVEQPPEIAKLLQGTPEEAIADKGPLLLRVRVDQLKQQSWLDELLASRNAHQHLLALLSPWPFTQLASHLSHCTQAEWNDGRGSGLLRFYDPRMLVPTSEALDPQQIWFHAPVIAWHWQDRDRQPRSLPGNLMRPAELPSPLPVLRLTRAQMASLFAWSAAEDYRRSWGVQPQDYGMAQQELLMRHLMHGQLAANREGLHDFDQRDAFVRAWLAENSPIAPPAEEAEVWA
ncbi:DUF4123 domain-containing protein [Pseudomonas daroniae]|uniref:DUF4123 domain-containing protein n=1 Tax=Phytopseudomonas daroniae TaxID=2487519 RepID=A0A4Q9QJX8_9GAMM|nr:MULTISPECIES: DUF4123 domain-containing protein [Pseudomonas]TBU76582.1 DUF4123 domain-containing protein [Pseudomonas daroniae]TBU80873.1 DUF4123 domain-containing protein [Pseudomonas sp. FRB 228]TBU90111.1 DUF4123 domain-containing protein [Pseudomonas daroniae]